VFVLTYLLNVTIVSITKKEPK